MLEAIKLITNTKMSSKRKRSETSTIAADARRSGRPRKEVNYAEEKIETAPIPPARTIKGSGGGSTVTIHDKKEQLPKRNNQGQLTFKDHPEFKPNLTPKEGGSI